MNELLDAACARAGGAVLLEGEAGIGKTALVGEARRLAADRGIRVLHARGCELEDDLAFGVARELYGPVERDLTFTGAAELAEPVLRVASSSGPTGDLFAVLHGLYWLVADLAAISPVLIVVDDAHWCDEPTLRHLAYLAHRLDGLPVALLLAARPATEPGRSGLLDTVAAEPGTVVHRLAPLPAAVVNEIVTSAFGDSAEEEFTAACQTASCGNPFLLTELLAEAAAAGLAPTVDDVDRLRGLAPPGVQRFVVARLARLPDDATALAQAAAVLGDGTSLHRAARLAGLAGTAAGPLADALVAARILQPQVAPAFAHPLVRSAVAATLGPSTTARWHRRAAELIAAEGGGGDELVPHLLAAPPCGDAWVVATLREAARRAADRGAPDVAARYLRRALEEPAEPADRPGLLHELGAAQARALSPDAPRTLTAALDITVDPVERGRTALDLLRSQFVTGRFVEVVEVCERVLDELGEAAPGLTLQLEADLLVAAFQDLRTRRSTARLRSRVDAPEPVGPAECRMLAALALDEVYRAGSRERAVELAENALVGDHLATGDAFIVLPCAVASLTFSGRVRRSLQVWDHLVPVLRRRGDASAVTGATAFRGYAAYHAGDLPRAIGDTGFAMQLARAAGGGTMMATIAAAWLAYALVDTGDHARADEALARQAACADLGQTAAMNYVLSARGMLRLAQGRAEDAVRDLRECGRRTEAWGIGPALFPWRPALALALHARGDRAAAAATAEEALAAARGWGTPHVLIDALRAAGLVMGRRALLEEAVVVAAAGESPLEHARALTDLGGALRRAGSVREAREPLRVAVDLAVCCGAGALSRRARDELVAAGARPRRLRSTGADALTASERRVASMAADGTTSREIAQALFVSEKTVETHLTRAYRKLGISARVQLVDALHGGPATPRLDEPAPLG